MLLEVLSNESRPTTSSTSSTSPETSGVPASLTKTVRLAKNKRAGGKRSRAGCATCRTKHIRCDETKPACKQCTSRGRRCSGFGYNQFFSSFPTSSTQDFSQQQLYELVTSRSKYVEPSRPPSNDVSATANRLVHIISDSEPGRNILSVGEFIKQVPNRLEHSPTLLAAAKALTCSVAFFHTETHHNRVQAIAYYGEALNAVNKSCNALTKPTAIINTLAAIGFMIISSGLLGHQGDYEKLLRIGPMELMQRLPAEDMEDDFDRQLVAITWHALIEESIMDTTIDIGPLIKDKRGMQSGPVATNPDAQTTQFHCLQWQYLSRLSTILKNPLFYRREITLRYREMLAESPRFVKTARILSGQAARAQAAARAEAKAAKQSAKAIEYIHCEAGNTGLLALALVLNITLQMMRPQDPSLIRETTIIVTEVIEAARRLGDYRPFGAARLSNALSLAYLAAQPFDGLRETMEGVMVECKYVFRVVAWSDLVARYQQRFNDIRALIKGEHKKNVKNEALQSDDD